MVNLWHLPWSFISCFIGLTVVGLLHVYVWAPRGRVGTVSSFGATAVLVYGAFTSPLTQPRNILLGNLIGAVFGISYWQLFHNTTVLYIGGALAVATSIVVMHVTKSIHPPAGATAFVAVMDPTIADTQGYFYILLPILFGETILLVVAILVDNMSKLQRFPEWWI